MNSIYLANEAMGTKIWIATNIPEIWYLSVKLWKCTHSIEFDCFSLHLFSLRFKWYEMAAEKLREAVLTLFTSIWNIFCFIMMIICFFVLIWVLKGAIQQQQMKFEVIKSKKKHAVLKKSRRKQKCNGRNSVT